MLCMSCQGTGEITWYIHSEHNYPPGTPGEVKCVCKDCNGTGYFLAEKEECEEYLPHAC